MSVRVGMRSSHAVSERRQLCLRTPHRVAICEAPEDVDPWPSSHGMVQRIHAQRDPVAVIDRKAVVLRDHTDHGVYDPAESDGLADDVRISLEATLPLLVRDHDDVRRALALVVIGERTTFHRCHPRHVKGRHSDLRDADQVRRSIRGHQRAAVSAVRAEIPHRRQPVSPQHEVVQRVMVRDAGTVHAVVLDRDDAIAFVQRQRRVQHPVDERERARSDRDRQRHSDHRHGGQSRILRDHAHTQLHIEPRHVQAHTPVVRAPLRREQRRAFDAHALDVAQAFERRPPRRLRIHAARDVVADALLDVEVELVIDLVRRIAPETKPPAPASFTHHILVDPSTRRSVRKLRRRYRPAHGTRKTVPPRRLALVLPPARRRQPVVFRPPVILREAPLTRDPTFPRHAVQRRIKRAFLDPQHVVRGRLDPRRDPVPVHRPP
jgi:hypothetical protein